MANFTPQEIDEILQQFFDIVGKRQYIGARYLPLIGRKGDTSVVWDGGENPYESLTIVTYLGDTYVSRKYVPAGIDISDGNYWAIMSQYNEQINQYRAEVAEVAENLTNFKNETNDNLNALESILPANAFSEADTVKDYIDSKTSSIEEIIPLESFTSEDTIKDYIDAQDTAIVNEYTSDITERMADFSNVVSQQITAAIGQLGSAQPSIVSNVGQMTDSTKIYVLSSNSHIYAWNGTAFEDTGAVYGISAETPRFVSNVNASNYTNVLPDIDYCEKNTIYWLNFAENTPLENLPANYPDFPFHTQMQESSAILVTYGSGGVIAIQTLIQERSICTRSLNISTHTPTGPWIITTINTAIEVTASNYASVLPDLNYARFDCDYIIEFANGTEIPITNMPKNVSDTSRILVTNHRSGKDFSVTQLIHYASSIYTRTFNYRTHETLISSALLAEKNNNTELKFVYVNAANYATVLPSINECNLDTTYMLLFDVNSTSIPADFPLPSFPNTITLIKHEPAANNTSNFVIETIESGTFKCNRIVNKTTHDVIGKWNVSQGIGEFSKDSNPRVYVDPNYNVRNGYSRGSFIANNILEGVLLAQSFVNVHEVHVIAGEYDLIAEYEARYGSLENFNASMNISRFNYGLQLNNLKLIGHGAVTIKFEYNGSNSFINREFSPIDTSRLSYDTATEKFTQVENIKIVAKNCRYCIHDEMGSVTGDPQTPNTHIFKRLNLYMDNTQNPNWTAPQCIGGGLGPHETVIVEDCIFDTPRVDGVGIVTYHNNASPAGTAESIVIIRNNYFLHGGIHLNWYGQSQHKTLCMVSNNSMEVPISSAAETPDTSPYQNMEIKSWNNEIRGI